MSLNNKENLKFDQVDAIRHGIELAMKDMKKNGLVDSERYKKYQNWSDKLGELVDKWDEEVSLGFDLEGNSETVERLEKEIRVIYSAHLDDLFQQVQQDGNSKKPTIAGARGTHFAAKQPAASNGGQSGLERDGVKKPGNGPRNQG